MSYRVVGTPPPTTLSVVVSGNLDTTRKSDTCVIVEDRVSAACGARCNHGVFTAKEKLDFIALHGSYIAPRDVSFISKRYKNIIIAFDNDTSENIEIARKYRELFSFMGNNAVLCHNSPEFKKQPYENLVNIIESLAKMWPINHSA